MLNRIKDVFSILAALALSAGAVHAQFSDGTKVGIATGKGLNTDRSGVFWSSLTESSNVIGDFYIDSLWHEGSVKLNAPMAQFGGMESDSLAGITVRYNVLNDELEVLASKNDIRVIKASYLKSFETKNNGNPQRFISIRSLIPSTGLKGICEVLSSGKLTLVKHYKPKITKPNYNPGFGTGQKSTIVRLDSDYYIVSNGKPEKFNASKKAVLAVMGDKEKEVEAYLNENKVGLKSDLDLKSVFNFYNKM
ncbi:hypothetical protein MUK70_24285 [Dyadobacter chenwenxiniae]|uniref:Uncharacterized protein n=1 Tax=Dyadobacter chenwenxiniae TaxID=2906456 RepID=A0A9X1PR06_9BACT|nr:hypothetical protein [Dyadobacter chenwenxiniae]MCF0065438.1 hypothetical protein [Dyadobacter chenwenxiniae]UON82153.1 hypothetical protein MUK70_24285 [Dyadobacter chenwenxiniae]